MCNVWPCFFCRSLQLATVNNERQMQIPTARCPHTPSTVMGLASWPSAFSRVSELIIVKGAWGMSRYEGGLCFWRTFPLNRFGANSRVATGTEPHHCKKRGATVISDLSILCRFFQSNEHANPHGMREEEKQPFRVSYLCTRPIRSCPKSDGPIEIVHTLVHYT